MRYISLFLETGSSPSKSLDSDRALASDVSVKI